MKKYKPSGFGTVEVILILVIVGLVGLTGWYVLRSRDKTNSATNSATPHTTNPYANWKKYVNNDYGFSFLYPLNTKTYKRCVHTDDHCKNQGVVLDYDYVGLYEKSTELFSVTFIKDIKKLTKATVSEDMGTGYGKNLTVTQGKVAGRDGFVAKVSFTDIREDNIYYVQNSKGQTFRIDPADSQLGPKIYATLTFVN